MENYISDLLDLGDPSAKVTDVITDNDTKFVFIEKKDRFIALFNKELNTTPNTFLTKVRLEHAVTLLTVTRFSVEKISHRCGFTTANYFIRVFKKHYGITPAAYRNEHISGTKNTGVIRYG